MTTAVAVKQPTDIVGLLELNRGSILQALPKTIKPDRFLRVCLNAISRNPDLQKCTASSLYAGIMQSAQFGLEIGLMNQAHLVPYWNSDKKCFEAQFQVGYLGLRDLGERYGDVEDGDAQAVHDKDFFDYGHGDAPFLQHKPSKEQNRGEIVHFYCWAKPKDGKIKVAVMSKEEVEKHRDRFVRKNAEGKFGPAWTKTFEAMGLKTVMRRCYKFLARSPELREAIALDEMQEINIPQNLGLELEQEQKNEAREANARRLEEMQTPAPTEPSESPKPDRYEEMEGVLKPNIPQVRPQSKPEDGAGDALKAASMESRTTPQQTSDAPADSPVKAFCEEQADKAAADEHTAEGFIGTHTPRLAGKQAPPGRFTLDTLRGELTLQYWERPDGLGTPNHSYAKVTYRHFERVGKGGKVFTNNELLKLEWAAPPQ